MLHHDGKPWLTPHPHMEDVAIFESPEGKTFEIDTGPGLPTCSIVVSRAPHPGLLTPRSPTWSCATRKPSQAPTRGTSRTRPTSAGSNSMSNSKSLPPLYPEAPGADPDPRNGSTPIHNAFGLSYSSYLVYPRCLLERMPRECQERLLAVLQEFDDKFPGHSERIYDIRLLARPYDPDTDEDSDPPLARDDLGNYRHPDMAAIDRQGRVRRPRHPLRVRRRRDRRLHPDRCLQRRRHDPGRLTHE